MALTLESALRKDKRNAGGTTFEHRHFASIAAMLKDLPLASKQTKADVIEYFADELARTNPRFDRKRFLTACGLEN